MAKELKVTFIGGDNLGDEKTLTVDRPLLVGRSHSSDVVVSKKDADVSGRHLEFRDEGDGIAAVCISRNGFLLNDVRVAEGESRAVHAGDVLSLGQRVRLRIDKVGDAAASADASTSATGATNASATLETAAAEFFESDTFATRAPAQAGAETSATRPFEATFATRAVAPDAIAAAPDAVAAAVGAGADDAVTADLGADRATDMQAPGLADAQTQTGDGDSSTGSGGGVTQEMHTRVGSMDEILRMKRVMEEKKRQRSRLMVFAFFAFVAVIGTIVFVRWPRMEEYLTLPMLSETEPDMATYDVVGAGGAVELTVGYPNDRRARVDGGAGGVMISSFVGKDRDVPFRIQLERVKAAAELERSLPESMEAAVAACRSRGCDFIQSEDGAGLESVSKAGIRFFEIEEPSSCGMLTQRGTGFIRREYVKAEGGSAWHGNLTVFRNGDVCYRLTKEIPEDEWSRGKYLLRDSFLLLRADFLRNHWESPGKAALVEGKTDDQLALAVRDAMETNRISEWPEISAMIDTLVVRSWNGPDDRRRTALALLKKFQSMQNEYYNRCKFRFNAGQIDGGGSGNVKMRDAYEKCKVAFGWNESDRRGRLINDPEEWKWQSKE